MPKSKQAAENIVIVKKQEGGQNIHISERSPTSNSPQPKFEKRRPHNIQQRLKIINEPPPNYQIEKLTKNLLNSAYQIKSKVREEKISEIKYKKLTVKEQIVKHQSKMVTASDKRQNVKSRERFFGKAGSKNADLQEDYKSGVEQLAKKIENSLIKSQLLEKDVTRNSSLKNFRAEPTSESRQSEQMPSISRKPRSTLKYNLENEQDLVVGVYKAD